jgi:hypothetical protein
MSSNQKIQAVSTPISMSRALKLYGVSTEEELRKLFDDLYFQSQRGFWSKIFIRFLIFIGFKKV